MLSPNAITVLEKRYLRKDDQGNLAETPEQLFWRVATATAEPDRLYGATDAQVAATAQAFYDLTYNLDFLPNSPTLANAGTELCQSACFVVPVHDDLGHIFDALKMQALIHQAGGGTGFDMSKLRPKDDRVGSTKGVASGPVSFLRIFNAATEEIKQGGMRRGANMGVLRIDHPDIMAFVDEKADKTKLKNFNVSVAITDAFMAAVEAGTAYDLVNPRTGKVSGQLDARTVFKHIVTRAHATGEPGLVFIDRMNRYCPVPWISLYDAVNPCAEQPLIPYESCNLGSLNLARFVKEDAERPGTFTFDWDRFASAIHTSMHFLDNVIDANHFPFPELTDMARGTRKVGLGVMGFARLLFRLGIAYGSELSFDLAEKVFSFLDFHSKLASVRLAQLRGQFPAREGNEAWSNGIYAGWCAERDDEIGRHDAAAYADLPAMIEAYGIRNSTTTTVAPTGTISIIADTSSGCEPVFALAFKRWQADTHMIEVDGEFLAALNKLFAAGEVDAIVEIVERHHGSLREALDAHAFDVAGFLGGQVEQLVELAEVFVTAHDLTPHQHVHMQAAFQRYNDSAVSKTINFAHTATVEDAEDAYMAAWRAGCKGITIYRDGSRDEQPLSTSSTAQGATSPDKASETPAVGVVTFDVVEGPSLPACGACGYQLPLLAPVLAGEEAGAACHTCPNCGGRSCS